ncbi:hypothetical protein AgCh_010187 [Apium graveolens]
MNHLKELQTPVAYPVPLSIDEQHRPAMAPLPPAGYPTKDQQDDAKLQTPRDTETRSRAPPHYVAAVSWISGFDEKTTTLLQE